MGRNFLGNNTALVISAAVATGTDASVQYSGSVADLATNGAARRVTALLQIDAVANAAAVIDLVLQTRPGTTGDWRTVGTLSGVACAADEYVGIEADTNSARLDRYVRLGYQRKTHNSTLKDGVWIFGDLRNPGTVAVGGISGGGVVREKTART